MAEIAQMLVRAAVIGVGATIVMDACSAAQKHGLGIRTLDYGLIGRWLAYLLKGRISHDPITASPPVAGEKAIGWLAHYATGVAFALLLLFVWGTGWTNRPTLIPAMIVGIGSLLFPLLVVQPALGFGIASCHTPHPAHARMKSLLTHCTFGLGLFIAGWITKGLWQLS
jgi:hypothetical protein